MNRPALAKRVITRRRRRIKAPFCIRLGPAPPTGVAAGLLPVPAPRPGELAVSLTGMAALPCRGSTSAAERFRYRRGPALRHALLGGYVLRSRDRAGAEQELWTLLAVYQALRMAMTAAAEAAGTDPDRASFTAALEAAREQVITARGIEDPGDPGDAGRIGRAVLAGLLPARRARHSARKVKCSTSRY